MIKHILVLFFLYSAFLAKAQFSIGIREGYGTNGLYLEPPTLTDFQVDYWQPSTGLVLIFNNNKNAGLQLEINYAQKGWKEHVKEIPGSSYIRSLTYLEVPVFGHWEIGYYKVRPIIFAGPYFAWKLKESSQSTLFDTIFNNAAYNHYYQDIRKLNYGLKVGIGLRYNITNRLAVFVDGRYNLQIAGGRDIFIDRPDGIQASRLTEMSGTFGIVWHMIPQKKPEVKEGYTPKEDLYEYKDDE